MPPPDLKIIEPLNIGTACKLWVCVFAGTHSKLEKKVTMGQRGLLITNYYKIRETVDLVCSLYYYTMKSVLGSYVYYLKSGRIQQQQEKEAPKARHLQSWRMKKIAWLCPHHSLNRDYRMDSKHIHPNLFWAEDQFSSGNLSSPFAVAFLIHFHGQSQHTDMLIASNLQ